MAALIELREDALTTIDAVNEELDVETGDDAKRDARIAKRINRASRDFSNESNRELFRKVGVVERVAGFGAERLLVKEHLPLETITSIEFTDGTTTILIDASEYEIENAARGWVRRIGGRWQSTDAVRQSIVQRRNPGSEELLWVVTYTGGYVTLKQEEESIDAGDNPELVRSLPDEIEYAVIDQVVARERRKGKDRTVESKKVGKSTWTLPAFL